MTHRKAAARLAFTALVATTLTACASGGEYRDLSVPIETVEAVDLNRYQGLWYEIARFPVFFEEGCVGVTAEYAARVRSTLNHEVQLPVLRPQMKVVQS